MGRSSKSDRASSKTAENGLPKEQVSLAQKSPRVPSPNAAWKPTGDSRNIKDNDSDSSSGFDDQRNHSSDIENYKSEEEDEPCLDELIIWATTGSHQKSFSTTKIKLKKKALELAEKNDDYRSIRKYKSSLSTFFFFYSFCMDSITFLTFIYLIDLQTLDNGRENLESARGELAEDQRVSKAMLLSSASATGSGNNIKKEKKREKDNGCRRLREIAFGSSLSWWKSFRLDDVKCAAFTISNSSSQRSPTSRPEIGCIAKCFISSSPSDRHLRMYISGVDAGMCVSVRDFMCVADKPKQGNVAVPAG